MKRRSLYSEKARGTRPLRAAGSLAAAVVLQLAACGIGRTNGVDPGDPATSSTTDGGGEAGNGGSGKGEAGSSSSGGGTSASGSSSGGVADPDGGTSPDSGGDGDVDASSDASSPPEILSLSESVASITQGGSFTVVAIVIDPGGLANLTGGRLTSASGAVLGAFASSTPGTYSVTVSWDQLNAITPIDFTGQTILTTVATFSNQQGLSTSRDITMELYCGSGAAPDAACAGQCVNLTSVDTCGSCSANCTTQGGMYPQQPSCAAPGVCGWEVWSGSEPDGGGTCSSVCASMGGTCASAQIYDGVINLPSACSSPLGDLDAGSGLLGDVGEIGCVCTDTAESNGEPYFSKTQTGNCATLCASLSLPCLETLIAVAWSAPNSGVTPYSPVSDSCSAPYFAVAGTTWDDLDQANLPAYETILGQGTELLQCECNGASQ